jgi:hypothetical protein
VVHASVGLLDKWHKGSGSNRGASALAARCVVGRVSGNVGCACDHVGSPGVDHSDVSDHEVAHCGEQDIATGAPGDTSRWGELGVDRLYGSGHAVGESNTTPSLLEDIMACRGGSYKPETHKSMIRIGARY